MILYSTKKDRKNVVKEFRKLLTDAGIKITKAGFMQHWLNDEDAFQFSGVCGGAGGAVIVDNSKNFSDLHFAVKTLIAANYEPLVIY